MRRVRLSKESFQVACTSEIGPVLSEVSRSLRTWHADLATRLHVSQAGFSSRKGTGQVMPLAGLGFYVAVSPSASAALGTQQHRVRHDLDGTTCCNGMHVAPASATCTHGALEASRCPTLGHCATRVKRVYAVSQSVCVALRDDVGCRLSLQPVCYQNQREPQAGTTARDRVSQWPQGHSPPTYIQPRKPKRKNEPPDTCDHKPASETASRKSSHAAHSISGIYVPETSFQAPYSQPQPLCN